MAKSWIVGGRSSGDNYGAGATSFFQIGSSIENDSLSTTRVTLPEALTARNWAVRCGANTLSVVCDVTIRKNDTTDTGLSVTFQTTDADVEIIDTGPDVTFAQDDDWVAKVVRGAGTGSITLLTHGVEIEPNNASSTLSWLCTKSAGSAAFTTAGSRFFAPFGARFNSTTEVFTGSEDTGVSWQSIGAFTVVYLQVATGTITWTGTIDVRTRVAQADGGCLVQLDDTDDQTVVIDTTGSDSIADGDEFDYELEMGAGANTLNIESIGCWLRSTNGEFLMAIGDRGGLRINAGITRYWHMQGEGIAAHQTETPAQLSAPFSMNFLVMEVMSDRERNTSTDSTATLRVEGAGTALSIAIPAAGGSGVAFGLFEDSGSVAVAEGELVDTEFVTGDGTNRDWCYVVYLVEEAGLAEVAINGAASPAGAITSTLGKAPFGSFAPAGALSQTPVLAKQGAAGPSGALATSAVRHTSVSGASTPAGALLKQAGPVAVGALSPTGAMTRRPVIDLQGMDTPFGDLAAAAVKTRVVAGILAPAGALLKLPSIGPSGTATPAGAVTKMTPVAGDGSVSSSGAFSSLLVVVLDLDGAFAPSGVLVLRVEEILSAELLPVGAVASEPAIARDGAIDSAGEVAVKSTEVVALDGALTPAGALLKLAPLAADGSASPAGVLDSSPEKSFTAVFAPIGTDSHLKVVQLDASGELSLAGELAIITETKLLDVDGTMSIDGALRLQAGLDLEAIVAPDGNVDLSSQLVLVGAINQSGSSSVFRVTVLDIAGLLTESGLLAVLPIVEIPRDVSLVDLTVRTSKIQGLRVVHQE